MRENHAEKCPAKDNDELCVCDGYHTFDELYDHRIALWINLCKLYFCYQQKMPEVFKVYPRPIWRSKKHSDGELAFGGGWFLLGICIEPGKQMTYHLPIERWDECGFAETLDQAPEFDGHTSDDVLERIKTIL